MLSENVCVWPFLRICPFATSPFVPARSFTCPTRPRHPGTSARTELQRGKTPSRPATSTLEEIPTDSRQLSCTSDPNPSDPNFEDIVTTTLGDSASPALSSLSQILPIFTRCVPERARRVLSENVYFRPFIKCWRGYDFSTPHFVPARRREALTRPSRPGISAGRHLHLSHRTSARSMSVYPESFKSIGPKTSPGESKESNPNPNPRLRLTVRVRVWLGVSDSGY